MATDSRGTARLAVLSELDKKNLGGKDVLTFYVMLVHLIGPTDQIHQLASEFLFKQCYGLFHRWMCFILPMDM